MSNLLNFLLSLPERWAELVCVRDLLRRSRGWRWCRAGTRTAAWGCSHTGRSARTCPGWGPSAHQESGNLKRLEKVHQTDEWVWVKVMLLSNYQHVCEQKNVFQECVPLCCHKGKGNLIIQTLVWPLKPCLYLLPNMWKEQQTIIFLVLTEG